MKDRLDLTDKETFILDYLLRDERIKAMRYRLQMFRIMIVQRKAKHFDTWLNEAWESGNTLLNGAWVSALQVLHQGNLSQVTHRDHCGYYLGVVQGWHSKAAFLCDNHGVSILTRVTPHSDGVQ